MNTSADPGSERFVNKVQLDPVNLKWGETWPTSELFSELAKDYRVIPVVRRLLADELTAVGIYRKVAAGRPGTFILESAQSDGAWNRWSFVGVNTLATLTGKGNEVKWSGTVPVGIPTSGKVLDVIAETLEELQAPAIPGLPPLTGSLVGSLGWDILTQWEPTLVPTNPIEIDVPDVTLCLATDVIAVDHQNGSIWLIANAINTDGSAAGVDAALQRSYSRLDQMEQALLEPLPTDLRGYSTATPPVARPRVSQKEFEDAVESAKNNIVEGDIFQVVLSQRLDVDCASSPLDVYRVLRSINPSPYMYYLQQEDFAIVGSSPETLVRVNQGNVTTFPIAGSRPRGHTPEDDRKLAEQLLSDPKERSEHVMLVDLARNDLAKVCEPGSVDVVEFMQIKRFSHIQHISSTVTGTISEDVTALDCLKATFPAGTLSGAPKPRAISLINEYEPSRRGVYGGVVGYFDLTGGADLAIAIRTTCIANGVASVQAGAGIVADSVPSSEYEEACNKAAAVIKAVQNAAMTEARNIDS